MVLEPANERAAVPVRGKVICGVAVALILIRPEPVAATVAEPPGVNDPVRVIEPEPVVG